MASSGKEPSHFPSPRAALSFPWQGATEDWEAFTDAHLPHPQVLWPVDPEKGGACSEESDESLVLGADMEEPRLLGLFSQRF